VALSGREIAQSAEIGVIEDVMNAIKLLPGVNYSGFISSYPSIRGGHPGDMTTSFDGFYINNPYFWGGAFSIFDPRMVESAQLSHGVFSSRYGPTISGLLEITSKKPSPTETQFELGMSTSEAKFNLSLPINNKGGILFMGRLTYYDPIIGLAKLLVPVMPELEMVNAIKQAPYIRAATVTGNYRFTQNLELTATGFFGMDGAGAKYENAYDTGVLKSESNMEFDFINYQAFFTSSLLWNPRNDMLLKSSFGIGYENTIIKGETENLIYDKEFSDYFQNAWFPLLSFFIQGTRYEFYETNYVDMSNIHFNLQGRLDYDWEITDNILLAAGAQERYSLYRTAGDNEFNNEISFVYLPDADKDNIKNLLRSHSLLPLPDPFFDIIIVRSSKSYPADTDNNLFTTSGYFLGEYNSDRFKAELGLRIDHFYLGGKGFSASSDPVLNPRLNLDFNIYKNGSFFQSVDIAAGTGLFSSFSNTLFMLDARYDIDKIKPNRSWTSIIGIKFELPQSFVLNIEGYYKYVYDRMYIPVSSGISEMVIKPNFDGEGITWGFDIMLQKIQGRYVHGWLTYSYNWAKYRDPHGGSSTGLSGGNRGDDWYYPSFHRFHNLNLILNFRPTPKFNIYLRFGFASGVVLSRRDESGPTSYPVLIYDGANPGGSYFIEKYYWISVLDESNRTTPSLPMDIKFSIFGGNPNGKTRYEVYFAIENVLSLFYSAQANISFNRYTGQIDTGSNTASYDVPFPIPSFGFKYSY
jgi:hypothetical protein